VHGKPFTGPDPLHDPLHSAAAAFGVGAPIITTSRIPTIRSPLYLIFDDLIMVKAFVPCSKTARLQRFAVGPSQTANGPHAFVVMVRPPILCGRPSSR
jgi:hypothetical protein